jgi:hypothetical protein
MNLHKDASNIFSVNVLLADPDKVIPVSLQFLLVQDISSIENVGWLVHGAKELLVRKSFELVPLGKDQNCMAVFHGLCGVLELDHSGSEFLIPDIIVFHLPDKLNKPMSTLSLVAFGSTK